VIRNFKDLVVWQKSVDLAVAVYELSRSFPREERFGLTAQIQRAAVSVSSNIAEGSGRATTKDLLHFLGISRGSLHETESLGIVSERLGFAAQANLTRVLDLPDHTGKVMTLHRRSLQTRR